MVYKDQYEAYARQIPDDIKKCKDTGKRHVFGYTSDLDVILKWDTNIFNDILRKYLTQEPSTAEGETIGSMEDFARIVSYYASRGLGGEVDISNMDVCEYLEKHFETTFSLGGTCAQGAAAMNAIGFPVITHFTDKSKEVCGLVNKPDFYMVNDKGLISIDQLRLNDIPVRHMVLQFSKGDRIVAQGKEYTIPVSNRVILDYDTIHKVLPLEKSFLDFCEKNASNIYSYNISGFNAIVDLGIMKERLRQLSEHYRTIKNTNPQCRIFFESAFYINTKCKMEAIRSLSEYIDIFGMNEEELVELSGQLGLAVDKENLESVLGGLELVSNRYGMRGIVLHTKDYAMYYGTKMDGVDIEKGLTLGNLMSSTRARTGRYGSYTDCLESLSKLKLSPVGLQFSERLGAMQTKRFACLVPSRYMEHPNCTIGLGDTFTAGVQICFTR